jgi:hypothetical protein
MNNSKGKPLLPERSFGGAGGQREAPSQKAESPPGRAGIKNLPQGADYSQKAGVVLTTKDRRSFEMAVAVAAGLRPATK